MVYEKLSDMRILAIETSCDETSLAALDARGSLTTKTRPRFKILKHVVSSQIKIHRPFGGVVPGLAKREHLKNLPRLFRKSGFHTFRPDLIAVTVGPGLEPALWTGIEFAKELYKNIRQQTPRVKILGVNHMAGHLYSFLLPQKSPAANYHLPITKAFPAIALIVSGGHTELLHLKNLTAYRKLGETRDDAAGECFDKGARLLGLPYPGGPEIEKAAQRGNSRAVSFPRPMLYQKNYDFSFSGLKTSLLYYIKERRLGGRTMRAGLRADLAASFAEAIFDVLIQKTLRAAKAHKAKSILLTGGVSASAALRERFREALSREMPSVPLVVPDFEFSTDNAAMIGAAAYVSYLGKKDLPLVADGTLDL